MRDYTVKRRDLDDSNTLVCVGRYSKSSSGSSGHTGDTRPGQARWKPKDLSHLWCHNGQSQDMEHSLVSTQSVYGHIFILGNIC